jgi:hypothetical protein
MRIEATITDLTKKQRAKLSGLQGFDDQTGLATFEWPADVGAPHDYPTAMHRVRDEAAALGGEATNFRLLG